MTYGQSAATAEGIPPKRFEAGRRCEACPTKVHRYATKIQGFILCERCRTERVRLGVSASEFVRSPKRATEGSGNYERNRKGTPLIVLPNLRSVRATRGLTIKRLHWRSRVGEKTIRRAEHGGAVSPRLAEKLAGALGVEVTHLSGVPELTGLMQERRGREKHSVGGTVSEREPSCAHGQRAFGPNVVAGI